MLIDVFSTRFPTGVLRGKYLVLFLSGYHADTPITIKAEAIRKADSRLN